MSERWLGTAQSAFAYLAIPRPVTPPSPARVAKLRQPIGQPQRRGAGIRRCDQRHFRPVDRRKTVLRGQHAVVGLDRHLGQDAEPHAGGDRGLDAGEARRRIGHVPGAARAFQRMDRARAIETAGGKTDQRHRAHIGVARPALAGDPMHALGPHRDADFFAGGALEQRQIEFAAFEIAPADKCFGRSGRPSASPDASAKTPPAISPADRRQNPRARRAGSRLRCRGGSSRRGLLPPATAAAAHRTAAARRLRSA